MPAPNRVRDAFMEGHNIVGLASVMALTAAMLSPLPFIVGAVAEAAYLLFVPDSKWYAERIEVKYDADVVKRREKLKEEVLPTVSGMTADRFLRLEHVRTQIDGQTGGDRKPYRQVLRKLDYLLEKFLLFGQKQSQFRAYLNNLLYEVTGKPVDSLDKRQVVEPGEDWARKTAARIQEHYENEIARTDSSLSTETNLHTTAIMEKRKEVLQRRAEYVTRIAETLTNLGYQLELMEDTFGLINDEIRARSPEQVLADIDGVVNQTDSLTERLEEVAPFDSASLADGAEKLYNVG